MEEPLLRVEGLVKRYGAGWPRRRTTFELQAHFEIAGPAVVGVMGANGAGKTTLFELMTGGNRPSSGRVLIAGQDIHRVRYKERGRLALHYHQSYQLRSFRRTLPSFMLQRSRSDFPQVHLFDEPQFNTQDGYIGFMLDFFRRLRSQGRLVFLCLHPNEPVHLDILSEICDRHVFMRKNPQGVSELTFAQTLGDLIKDPAAAAYLGKLTAHLSTPAAP